MKFILKIISKDDGKTQNPISLGSREIGIDHLDRVRNETGVPNLKKEIIVGDIFGKWESSQIVEVPEDTARESGLFREQNRIHIYVPPYYLNRFVYEHLIVNKNPETGEITDARFLNEIDESKLIKAWVSAGYPTEWGFDNVNLKECQS